LLDKPDYNREVAQNNNQRMIQESICHNLRNHNL